MFESFDAFLAATLAVFPEAVIDEDREGHIIIHTNLMYAGDPTCAIIPVSNE